MNSGEERLSRRDCRSSKRARCRRLGAQRNQPALIGLIGRSSAGRTTIITDMIDRLRGVKIAVSALKGARDAFDLDQPTPAQLQWRSRLP